jgi:hypothetical protein
MPASSLIGQTRKLALLLALLFPTSLHAEERIISGSILLTKDELWEASGVVFKGDAIIQTNGHRLVFTINGNMHAEPGARIFRGEDLSIFPIPDTPTPAARGKTFDRGPNTDGQGVRKDGRPGGEGSAGTAGVVGFTGRSGDEVTIVVTGVASGSLEIDEAGGPGGTGGKGGDGGPGGDGEQGGRGESEKVLGVVVGAKAGPAAGGKGGDGGVGGKGGNGGPGGDGGRVQVIVMQPAPDFSLVCRTHGGAGEAGGNGGDGGAPGQPGYGGRGGPGINGREEQRKGAPGNAGAAGQAGNSGAEGKYLSPAISEKMGSVSIRDRAGNLSSLHGTNER